MTEIEELQDRINELNDDCAAITAQLDHAKALGDINPLWAARARTALRFKRIDFNNAQRELSILRKAERSRVHFRTKFYDVCKRELEPSDMDDLVQMARDASGYRGEL